MKLSNYILRGTALLLLGVMLHSHVCSALCAYGFYSCCGETEQQADCCKKKVKSCCEKKENGEMQDDGCQKEHLIFFGTIGQYHFVKADAAKVFQPVVEVPSKEIIKPVISTEIAFAYTGFHPPPPKENILILIQSFLI